MSTPTTLFDHQAQPFWDEAGNYFPPGFDPQTGQWLDPAYEEAYAQGFVWDAALQDWVPLDLAGTGELPSPTGAIPAEGDALAGPAVVPEERPALDDPAQAQALLDAILQVLAESPEQAPLLAAADGGARLQALAREIAQATKCLLDAIARDADETTALAGAADKATIQRILAILQEIAPRPADAAIDLQPETAFPSVPAPLAAADVAPAPRLLAADDEARSLGAEPLPGELWAVVEARDRVQEVPEDVRLAALIDTPPLPFEVAAEAPLEAQIAREGSAMALRLKNATPLALGFDGEVDLRPHPRAAAHPAAAPSPGAMEDLRRKIARALDILARAEPAHLSMSICIPLEGLQGMQLAAAAAVEAAAARGSAEMPALGPHSNSARMFPNARSSAGDGAGAPVAELPADDIELALTALADSVGQRPSAPHPHLPAAEAGRMPMVRLKRPDRPLPGEGIGQVPAATAFTPAGAEAPTVRMKRPRPGEEFVEVITPIDLPSDDIELALTTLASFVKRQSMANQAASAGPVSQQHASQPPRAARRAPPPPLPSQRPVPSKKPPLPAASRPSARQPTADGDPALMRTALGRSAAQPSRPSSVPVAIALNGSFRVLCRTLDGVVHRGILRYPNLTAPTLTLEIHPGPSSLALETKSLQAIFFLRRPGQEIVPPEGRKARLLFKSGRQRSGYIPAFDPHGSGFFFYPSETQDSPTDFWFVYGAALASIDFE